jgi:hypothetical protein
MIVNNVRFHSTRRLMMGNGVARRMMTRNGSVDTLYQNIVNNQLLSPKKLYMGQCQMTYGESLANFKSP